MQKLLGIVIAEAKNVDRYVTFMRLEYNGGRVLREGKVALKILGILLKFAQQVLLDLPGPVEGISRERLP